MIVTASREDTHPYNAGHSLSIEWNNTIVVHCMCTGFTSTVHFCPLLLPSIERVLLGHWCIVITSAYHLCSVHVLCVYMCVVCYMLCVPSCLCGNVLCDQEHTFRPLR